MRLTRDYIIKHIQETKYPIWSLFVVKNYSRVPIMYYNGDDFTDTDTPDAKVEKSIKRLNAALADFPPDTLLSIDLRTSKNANGSGLIGPLEFYNRGRDDEQPANFSGVGNGYGAGFGVLNPPAGWVHESTLNGKLEELRAANERQINNLLFKQREHEFNERVRREREELKEMRKELNEERKKYESNTGAAAETLVFAVKRILGELFPQLPFGNQGGAIQSAPAQAQLAGAAEDDEDPEEQTPKYKAVEALAEMLYNNKTITAEAVNALTRSLSEELNKKKQPQPQPQPQQQDNNAEEGGGNA